MSDMTALLLGATGETGRELLKHLCDCGQYTKVILVGRRKVEDGPTSDKVEQRVVDFDNLVRDQPLALGNWHFRIFQF